MNFFSFPPPCSKKPRRRPPRPRPRGPGALRGGGRLHQQRRPVRPGPLLLLPPLRHPVRLQRARAARLLLQRGQEPGGRRAPALFLRPAGISGQVSRKKLLKYNLKACMDSLVLFGWIALRKFACCRFCGIGQNLIDCSTKARQLLSTNICRKNRDCKRHLHAQVRPGRRPPLLRPEREWRRCGGGVPLLRPLSGRPRLQAAGVLRHRALRGLQDELL